MGWWLVLAFAAGVMTAGLLDLVEAIVERAAAAVRGEVCQETTRGLLLGDTRACERRGGHYGWHEDATGMRWRSV